MTEQEELQDSDPTEITAEDKKTLVGLLDYIERCAGAIYGDWSDARHHCGEIWEAISRAKELLEEDVIPYQHVVKRSRMSSKNWVTERLDS